MPAHFFCVPLQLGINIWTIMCAQGVRNPVLLHYEKLVGDKKGISSVKVNDQYRIEFTEETEDGKQIATICNITELSNHYK